MLTCFCGKMGAGKTTRSRIEAAEKNAVLLSEDVWLAAHYPDQIHTFDDYLKYARQIRGFVRQHVQAILGTGTNVVMDFPANTRQQRQWFVQLCAEIACELELVYLARMALPVWHAWPHVAWNNLNGQSSILKRCFVQSHNFLKHRTATNS